MRKIKTKSKEKFDINKYTVEQLKQAELFYHMALIQQCFSTLIREVNTTVDYDFKKLASYGLMEHKSKILFTYKANVVFNEYKTSELIKLFLRMANETEISKEAYEVFDAGVFHMQYNAFIKKCNRMYTDKYLRYVIHDSIDIKDVTSSYVGIKQAVVQFKALYGELFNDRISKTFFTKFAKWCLQIERDLCQVSLPVKLDNKTIAFFKNAFKEVHA